MMLALVWSANDPHRLGEVLIASDHAEVFGRGEGEGTERRARLVRQRPGRTEPAPVLENPFLSRRHLSLRGEGATIVVENFGKRPLLHGGEPAETELVVRPGETIEIHGQAVFVCVQRPRLVPGSVV